MLYILSVIVKNNQTNSMNEKEISIINRLRDFRKEKHLSQVELADALGVSRQSVISLEQGKCMPSLPLAISICDFFDTAFEEVFRINNEIEKAFDQSFAEHDHKLIKEPETTGSGKEHNMALEVQPWRPFREVVSLRDAMDRLFEDSVITPKSGGMPKIDIKDTKGAIVVKAELPGMSEDEINVEVHDGVMTISGEKKEEAEKEDEGYYYKESHSGAFSRSFTLPADVKEDKAEAEMKHGILWITVPKTEAKQPKKIAIKKSAK